MKEEEANRVQEEEEADGVEEEDTDRDQKLCWSISVTTNIQKHTCKSKHQTLLHTGTYV